MGKSNHEQKTGYLVCSTRTGSWSIIPGVEHIEVDAEYPKFKSDYDAAKQAEKDGIKIIHDMEGVEDWTYVDTPENREQIAVWLAEHPEYYCRNR